MLNTSLSDTQDIGSLVEHEGINFLTVKLQQREWYLGLDVGLAIAGAS